MNDINTVAFNYPCDACLRIYKDGRCAIRSKIEDFKKEIRRTVHNAAVQHSIDFYFDEFVCDITMDKCRCHEPVDSITSRPYMNSELIKELRNLGYTEEQINNSKYVVCAQKEVILI